MASLDGKYGKISSELRSWADKFLDSYKAEFEQFEHQTNLIHAKYNKMASEPSGKREQELIAHTENFIDQLMKLDQ